MPKKRPSTKRVPRKAAGKGKSGSSATPRSRSSNVLPFDAAALQADYRDTYDLAAAGLKYAGVIHPLFTSVRGLGFIDALYRRLLLATEAVIGARDYQDVFHSGDVDWELWNALAVRGCVRLAEQAKAQGKLHDEAGLLFRAAVLWCMSPDETREKYQQYMAKPRKQAGVEKTNKKARLTKFLADFLAARKKSPASISDDDIVARMAAPVSGTKHNLYGADLSTLRKYLAACKKNGQVPNLSR